MRHLWSRLLAKTPKIFRIIRNIGLTVAAFSVTITTSGIALPGSLLEYVSQIGLIAGAVAAGISQLTTTWGIDEDGNIIK